MARNAIRSPTLDDVAARASVSAATVSRFLNNPRVVAEDTADRIREAISETGYIPNALAGGLATSRTRMVAVLIPYLVDSFFNATIETMAEELTANGNNVMLGITGASLSRTEELIRGALARRVDAIISTGPLNDTTIAMVKASRALFIQIWELPPEPIGIAIGFSHHDAGRDIARFVLSRGYRSPFLVTADGERARQRRQGFVEEWLASGGQPPAEMSIGMPSSFGQARRVFADMRRRSLQPDVVVCGTDALAQGLIVEAQTNGMKVPDDLAVMGFGNSPLAGEMRPTITSVDIDGARIAREAMAAIRRHADGEAASGPRLIDVGFRLIARESA